MNLEQIKSEVPDESVNLVDTEFDYLEKNFDDSEKAVIITELLEDIFDPQTDNLKLRNNVKEFFPNGDEIKHYFLPGIPGGEGGTLKDTREGYDERVRYYESPERKFLQVGQGEMWKIPRTEKFYAQMLMSECSGLVGYSDKDVFIAHISYSTTDQIGAALSEMVDNGVEMQNIYAVTSTFGKNKNQPDRAGDIDDYRKIGLIPDNVMAFEFSFKSGDSENPDMLKNLGKAVVGSDVIYKYEYDAAVMKNGNTRRYSDYFNGEIKSVSKTE